MRELAQRDQDGADGPQRGTRHLVVDGGLRANEGDDVRELAVGHAHEVLRRHGGGATAGQDAVTHDVVPVAHAVVAGAAARAAGEVGAQEGPHGGVVHHHAAAQIAAVALGARVARVHQVLPAGDGVLERQRLEIHASEQVGRRPVPRDHAVHGHVGGGKLTPASLAERLELGLAEREGHGDVHVVGGERLREGGLGGDGGPPVEPAGGEHQHEQRGSQNLEYALHDGSFSRGRGYTEHAVQPIAFCDFGRLARGALVTSFTLSRCVC